MSVKWALSGSLPEFRSQSRVEVTSRKRSNSVRGPGTSRPWKQSSTTSVVGDSTVRVESGHRRMWPPLEVSRRSRREFLFTLVDPRRSKINVTWLQVPVRESSHVEYQFRLYTYWSLLLTSLHRPWVHSLLVQLSGAISEASRLWDTSGSRDGPKVPFTHPLIYTCVYISSLRYICIVSSVSFLSSWPNVRSQFL